MRSPRVLALALAATALGSGSALAADPPTILTAGIDSADRLYVTWSLAPGTTYASAGFATGPWPEPGLPSAFFAGNATGGSDDCVPPPGVTDGPCKATPTSTSFRAPEPSARDRRYFVKVAALPATGPPRVTSAIWVIDEAKPLIPGFSTGEGPPTNRPAGGRSLAGAPLPAVPAPTISLPAPPRTIRTVLTRGIRLRVRCPTFQCALEDGSLSLGATSLASESDFVPAGRTHTFVFRPAGAGRTRLKARTRARLTLRALVRTADGRSKRLERSFTVRR